MAILFIVPKCNMQHQSCVFTSIIIRDKTPHPKEATSQDSTTLQ